MQGFENLRHYIDTWTDLRKESRALSSMVLSKELYGSLKDLADLQGISAINLISQVLQRHVDNQNHVVSKDGNGQ